MASFQDRNFDFNLYKRFEITETEGSVKGFYVVVDKETGVNYIVAKFGTGGGICPLVDKDGRPIVTK
ncbi:hypothetical protein E1963_13735 [Extibacter muris]|uniref:DUF6440 domain-containing protein n=1 Tax=Extibacter muris TaxID=1796622 RepID=A0A4R4FCP7_9FIRM|nr:hypothetical protein E1963_13735 [Extibacter muris]